MALAFVVTLENDLPDPAAAAAYAKGKTGKALAREADRLAAAARRRSVPALTSFLSESRESVVAQLVADGFDPAKIRVPAEVWFPPADGLAAVRALASHVEANLNDFKQPNPILRDLRAAEALLAAAGAAGVRFHFTSVAM